MKYQKLGNNETRSTMYETQNLMKNRKLAKMCLGGWLSPKRNFLIIGCFSKWFNVGKAMFFKVILSPDY